VARKVFMIVKGFAPESGVRVFVIMELCPALWITARHSGRLRAAGGMT
jgi:hypothetical protein